MPAKQLIDLEASDATKNLEHLGRLRPVTDGILWFSHQLPRISPNVGTTSVTSLARLMLDSCVHVEQALLCTLRGQPKLGWASLRIASEALKDLDAIERCPELHELWLAIGNPASSQSTEAAMAAFKAKRRDVPDSTVTEVCLACMAVCSHLGSHSNATSWKTLGPATPLPGKEALLPARLADPETLRFHVGQISIQSMSILSMLLAFRLRHLTPSERDTLVGYFAQVKSAFIAAFPDAEMVVYDD